MDCDPVPSAVPPLPRASEWPQARPSASLIPGLCWGFGVGKGFVSLTVANLSVRAGWDVGIHCPVRKVLTGVPEHPPGVWETVPLCPRSQGLIRTPQGSS